MTKARGCSVFGLIFVLTVLTGPVAADTAELPLIVLDVADTTARFDDSGTLDILLSNYYDTVAAFQFQLRLDRPDLVAFDLAAGGFDTAGTLISGFEAITVNDTSGTGALLLFTCIANLPFDQVNTPGIGPQPGGTVVRLPYSVAANPDVGAGLTCNLEVINPFLFSDQNGNAIGYITETLLDTIYWQCAQWDGDSCLMWEAVDGYISPYDSVEIYEYYVGHLDTTIVIAVDGSITLEPHLSELSCDINADGGYSISDLTCLISYLFGGFNSSACPNLRCDCDASGNDPEQPNISDLTCLVNFLFRGGPTPGA